MSHPVWPRPSEDLGIASPKHYTFSAFLCLNKRTALTLPVRHFFCS
jgi:hypothetical protein